MIPKIFYAQKLITMRHARSAFSYYLRYSGWTREIELMTILIVVSLLSLGQNQLFTWIFICKNNVIGGKILIKCNVDSGAIQTK